MITKSEQDAPAGSGEDAPPAQAANPPVIAMTDKADGPNQPEIPSVLPILPIRGVVVFPGTVVPLTLGRPSALKLVDESLPQSKILGLVTQRNEETEKPGADDLYPVGVAAQVLKLMRQPDGTMVLLVQAMRRIRLGAISQIDPFIRAEIEILPSVPAPDNDETLATFNNLRESAVNLLDLSPEIPEQARLVLANIEDPAHLTDLLAGNLGLDVEHKQGLLEEIDVVKRMRLVQEAVTRQTQIAELQQKLRKDVEGQFSTGQRRAYLREQIRAIQRELGEEEPGSEDQVEQLRTRLTEAGAPENVMQTAEKELRRLTHIPSASPEYSVIVSYVEMLADLPWNKLSGDNTDLNHAQEVLDHDHYGLTRIKRRLIEYLAVRKLNPTGRGPILCFLGPPGVGKTSLGQSIADALGRKFARISFGGLRDEAEVRGHRRTYIGSMPGRIIQELRRLGTRNPVLLLDEVDKLGGDSMRGDPASALLEVLDPRQNDKFTDRYLDVPFDLSQVIFIATANYIEGIPGPLRDRMEIISLPGYTAGEKLRIAQNYLVRRQLEENGLKPEQCVFQDDALRAIIDEYRNEEGVRDLERRVVAVCRSVAAEVARGADGPAPVTITPDFARGILGVGDRMVREEHLKVSAPGVVTGLAYTPAGGEILFIEATKYPGKGGVMLTGQIGDVMKESMQAALSLVRTRAKNLGIDEKAFTENDLHVHVPSGAIPKDGPSAGCAMFTALASLFTDRKVRSDVAMTGEITLRGLTLPIGGLKEKSLAALRAGVSEVIIPKMNEKDLADIPAEAKEKLKFTLAETVDDVLAAALERPVA